MHKQFLILCFFLFSLPVLGDQTESPFTPKSYLIRYWNKEIRTDLPKSDFLIAKASPLNAVDSAKFSKLATDQNALSANLHSLCASAKLLCFPDLSPSLEKHDSDSNFKKYSNRNFTNYGTDRLSGVDSFANYSDGENVVVDSFRRYSRDSTGHQDKFVNYGPDVNVPDQSFNGYGAGSTGGAGTFDNYNPNVNVPKLNFNSYSDDADGRKQKFTTYTSTTNAGDERFASYGKNGNGAPNEFTSYGKSSNVIGSDFNGYGETANGANNTFTSYGFDGNVPVNTFKNYGNGGNSAIDTFASYREQSNVGDDTFQSYGKNSNTEKANFVNYGKSFNEGSSKFSGYGKGASDQKSDFKIYGFNTTFTDYAKKGVTFAQYTKKRSSESSMSMMMMEDGSSTGIHVNKWIEPGKFFRESKLKKGTVIPMPDIRDKMPERSFLPRTIVSKLPFSTSKLGQMKTIFHAGGNSSMEGILVNALSECERSPSPGETKRCVASAEDMIDLATSVLGRSIVVRTTENVAGSTHDVLIGSVNGINGGKATKAVSCHQSLFPYLLYYCHSVPKVRVYEADLLDPKTKKKINHGVAICHLDTSAWSPTHGAFLALGSAPGKIEVCHWIFQNDMTWNIAD